MRKISSNGHCMAYYLHIDVKSFFVTINKFFFNILAKTEKNSDRPAKRLVG